MKLEESNTASVTDIEKNDLPILEAVTINANKASQDQKRELWFGRTFEEETSKFKLLVYVA